MKKPGKMSIKTISVMDMIMVQTTFALDAEKNIKNVRSDSERKFMDGLNETLEELLKDFIGAVIKESERSK